MIPANLVGSTITMFRNSIFESGTLNLEIVCQTETIYYVLEITQSIK